MSKHVKVNSHTGEVSAMHELPRDLVTILRTEARNQRTPPIDYAIAEDGLRMVVRPEPDIAMAELLEEAAAALAEARKALEEAKRCLAENGYSYDHPESPLYVVCTALAFVKGEQA